MWCKLLCSSRSSRRADRLAEKSTGSDVNWFQLRSSFSRKDKDKNACGKRGKYPERQREASIYCIITSSSSYFFCFYRCKQTPSILPLPSLATCLALKLRLPPFLFNPLIFTFYSIYSFPPSILVTFHSFSSTLFLPVVVFPVSGCWPAPAHAGTTVQWRLACQSGSDCFLPAPAAMCRVGYPWEHARTLGHGSPPGQRARNKCTGVNTTVSSRQTEKGIWGNKRQKGRREGTGKRDTYFPGQQQEGGQFVQRRRWNEA